MKINRNTSNRNRIAAAALAVGATLTGAFGAAAPANAIPEFSQAYFVALAYSFQSDIAGTAVKMLDADQARLQALSNCQDSGGNHCVWFGTFMETCAAMAILGVQEWNTATGPSRAAAEQAALAQNPGSHIAVSACANPGLPTKHPGRVPLEPLTQAP